MPLVEDLIASEVRRQHLESHHAVHAVRIRMIGSPSFAHAAATQQLYESILPERCPIDHDPSPNELASTDKATLSPADLARRTLAAPVGIT
jgi:hypothetical protein